MAVSLTTLPPIATARLRLRPLRPADAEAFRRMTDEPAVIDAINFLHAPFTLADARRLIAGEGDGRDCFLGRLAARGRNARGDGRRAPARAETMEIGYWFSSSVHGLGVGGEAVGSLVKALRTAYPERRLFAECRPENGRRGRLLERETGLARTGPTARGPAARSSRSFKRLETVGGLDGERGLGARAHPNRAVARTAQSLTPPHASRNDPRQREEHRFVRVVSVSTAISNRSAKPSTIRSTRISGRGGAGGDRERAHVREHAPIDRSALGTSSGDPAALALGDFAQALRIGRIGGADDDHRLDLPRGLLDRFLPVGRGVADVLHAAARGLRETGA